MWPLPRVIMSLAHSPSYKNCKVNSVWWMMSVILPVGLCLRQRGSTQRTTSPMMHLAWCYQQLTDGKSRCEICQWSRGRIFRRDEQTRRSNCNVRLVGTAAAGVAFELSTFDWREIYVLCFTGTSCKADIVIELCRISNVFAAFSIYSLSAPPQAVPNAEEWIECLAKVERWLKVMNNRRGRAAVAQGWPHYTSAN